MKATAIAPSNIAFIKYWGRKNEVLRLPTNGSISMNLSNLLTTTTVEFDSGRKQDEVFIDGLADKKETDRVINHLNRIRKLAKIKDKARVASKNNFPSSVGLSSSASGFAALTLAGTKAAGLNLAEKQLSILARQGSGSACRSIPSGFVEWLDGNTSGSSYAVSLYPPDYWEIVDIVAIVSKEKKEVSTSEGQKLAKTSFFYKFRQTNMNNKIRLLKKYLKEKKFGDFGELAESEALEMHAIMLTSNPSLIYWTAGSLELMKLVKKWRQEGLAIYFTINTGQDIHLLCQKKDTDKVVQRLKRLPFVKKHIINFPAKGAKISSSHLF